MKDYEIEIGDGSDKGALLTAGFVSLLPSSYNRIRKFHSIEIFREIGNLTLRCFLNFFYVFRTIFRLISLRSLLASQCT